MDIERNANLELNDPEALHMEPTINDVNSNI